MIADITMPEQDGIETIGIIRDRYPLLKIIATSGGGRVSATDYLLHAAAPGADCTLPKPFSDGQLKAAFDQVLPPSK